MNRISEPVLNNLITAMRSCVGEHPKYTLNDDILLALLDLRDFQHREQYIKDYLPDVIDE